MAKKAESTSRANRVSQKAETEEDPCHSGKVFSRTPGETPFAKITLPASIPTKGSPNTKIGEWECQECGEINPP